MIVRTASEVGVRGGRSRRDVVAGGAAITVERDCAERMSWEKREMLVRMRVGAWQENGPGRDYVKRPRLSRSGFSVAHDDTACVTPWMVV